jgi:hypothetical protein
VRPHNREVPRELDVVVQKAMDPDRERRYADVEQFADDLLAVLQRRPIRARRLGASLRGWRWCQRHRVVATALACALLVALLLPGLFAWRERATNAALQASNRAAEQSLATTLETIYGLLVRVSDDRLRYVPSADRVARDVLQDARTTYAELWSRHPGHARLQLDAGRALSRLGEMLARQGDDAAAAVVLREGLGYVAGDPAALTDLLLESRLVLRTNLANTLGRAGDRAGAAAELALADADAAALTTRPTAARAARQARLQITLERAWALDPMLAAEPQQALMRQALALARELADQHPDDHRQASKAIAVLDTLATALAKNERHDEAEALLADALARAEALPADARIWPPASAVVADVEETLGNLHVERRDQRGIPLLKDCLARRERLVHDHPADVEFRSDLAAALHNLARMNWYQEQDDLAVERLERAIALQRSVLVESPRSTQARDYLRQHLVLRGSALGKLGRRADLDATTDELAAMATDLSALRSAARLRLRSAALLASEQPPPADAVARREVLLANALDLLLRAEALGWGTGNPLGQSLYDPLRDRPEFTALQQRRAAAEAARKPAGR